VNSLIREALIEGREDQEKYEKDGYTVRWSFINDLELIFVVRGVRSALFPSRREASTCDNCTCVPCTLYW
jgi:hypothetical protein